MGTPTTLLLQLTHADFAHACMHQNPAERCFLFPTCNLHFDFSGFFAFTVYARHTN